MRSVRITRHTAPSAGPHSTSPRPADRDPEHPPQTDITWHHPETRLPLLTPQATALPHRTARKEPPQPRQGSPTPDPRPPTTQRRPRWSADTR
jgi:hypothetical protein